MSLVIFLLGAIGHSVFWVALVNRLHGLGIRRFWVDALTVLCCALWAGIPLAILYVFFRNGTWQATDGPSAIAWDYLAVCAIICVAAALQRWYWQLHAERRGVLHGNHTMWVPLADSPDNRLTAPGIPRLLASLPGNQALSLCVQVKQLTIPRLLPAYEGIRIAHISDLHMSGRILRAYFVRVVEEVNRCEADLIAITGDIVEREECLAWIPETLGRLQAPCGVFCIFGNHDRHVDFEQLKSTMADAGLTYLGGVSRKVVVRDTPVILAGNELPWYHPPADLREYPDHDNRGLPLRIVLAHSPDQFSWARQNEVDLILAGHNHGGQICLPVLGPIVAPSLHGVRYASGVFAANSTVMHVSRGTSSLTPFRWNCPPEIAVLELKSPAG